MSNIKKYFENPKKAFFSSLCALAMLIVLGTATTHAVSAIAESNSIGAENARNFAFADAGVDPVSAQMVKTEFDFEQGQFVYEVEFTANGTEYEYWVKANDGAIVKKETKIVGADGKAASLTATTTATITVEEARKIVLDDAQLSSSDVVFTEEKLDREGQLYVYEFSFYTEDAKYEYDVNAETGSIYSKSKEIFVKQVQQDITTIAQPENNTSPETSEAQTEQPAAASLPTQQTQQTLQAQQPVSGSDSAQSGGNNGQSSQAANGTDLEAAKSTALTDAGVSSSDATFTKTKKDYDDGIAVYEIEFYTSTHKYEYEINVSDGKIVSKDVEAFQTNGGRNAGNSGAYIGIDSAKAIALSHAGLSASDVTFSKAKLENDDGYTIYEIEFYYNGMEWEYSIEAVSGDILEYDYDRD